jgi:hypothetical protein
MSSEDFKDNGASAQSGGAPHPPDPAIPISGVKPNGAGEGSPEDIFSNLKALRRAVKPTIKREVKITEIDVKKPKNDVYFRVLDDDDWRFPEAPLLVNSRTGDFMFVGPSMLEHEKIKRRIRTYDLVTACSWPGMEIFIWPVPVLTIGKKPFSAWKTQREAYEQAKTEWTILVWDDARGQHFIEVAEKKNGEVTLPQPNWPTEPDFQAMMRIGFAEKTIISPDHPYVMQLRGRAD